MATRSKYLLKIHPQVSKNDIPELPVELPADFFNIFLPILKTDPYNCQGFAHHRLKGRLKDYWTLEIEWLGNPNAYRLVYRIYEKPVPKRVVIVSFDKHDPAYDKAKERENRWASANEHLTSGQDNYLEMRERLFAGKTVESLAQKVEAYQQNKTNPALSW